MRRGSGDLLFFSYVVPPFHDPDVDQRHQRYNQRNQIGVGRRIRVVEVRKSLQVGVIHQGLGAVDNEVGGAVQNYALIGNGHWHLTRFPKVIYNYDNTPKYYEFGLVAGGYLIGTVTTYAQKEIAGVIAYLLPLLDYSCDSLDYYVGMYPTRYYGTGGVCYLKNCDEPLEDGEFFENYSTEKLDREFMFSQMDQDDIDGMIADCNEEGSDIDLLEDIAERDAYWDQMEEFESEHPCIFEIDGAILSSISLDAFQAGTWNEDSCADSYLISLLVSILDYAIGYYNTFTFYCFQSV